jgi:hypothetical protein
MTTNAREWRALMEAGATVAAYMDLDEVLRHVLPYAATSAKAEWGCVILHDVDAHEFVVAAAAGPLGESLRGWRFSDTSGTAGAVLASDNRVCSPTFGNRKSPSMTSNALRGQPRDH